MSHIHEWVDAAVEVAMKSPCRSKRGVIIANNAGRILCSGFNDQPAPFVCNGSPECKANCGLTAVHAEQAALFAATRPFQKGTSMLHVKAQNGKPCASQMPSCLQCSKLILAAEISWMHLLHDPNAQMLPGAEVVGEVEGVDGPLQVRCYSAIHFHWLTAEFFHRIDLRILQDGLPTIVR